MLKFSKIVCNGVQENKIYNFITFVNDVKGRYSIVFAHDILGNHNDFQFLFKEFTSHSIITVDLAGHALSNSLNTYSYDQYLQDCLSVLNVTGCKNVIWIGQGIGGILGATLASYENSPIFGLVAFDITQLMNANVNMVDVEYNHDTLREACAEFYKKYEGIDRQTLSQMFLHRYKIMNCHFTHNYDLHLVSQVESFFNVNVTECLDKVKCHSLIIDDQNKLNLTNEKITVKHVDKVLVLMHQKEHLGWVKDWVENILSTPEFFLDRYRKSNEN